jgi:Cu-processing system permease protein
VTAASSATVTAHPLRAAAPPGPIPAALALARWEVAGQLRGRTLPAVAVLLGLAALGIAATGLSAGGALTVQGFGRTAVSLLQLVLWVVPLIALADNAVAAAESYEMETLAAQPVGRGLLLTGRALGRFASLSAALLIGLGAAGLVIGSAAGPGDGWRYGVLMGAALGLAAATTALGTLVGVLARSRVRALATAIGLWLVLTVGFDLAAIACLSMLPRAELTWSLSGLLLLNPVDTTRALGAGLFGADALAGPMGAALRRVLGPAGLAVLGAGLLCWTVGPLALAARLFARRDLAA